MAGVVFSKGSGLNNSVFGKSYEPIKALIETKAEAFEQKSQIKSLFVSDTSDKFGEKVGGMTAMSGFQPVGEGGAFPLDSMQEGYSKFLEHETWKDQFEITREMIDDSTTLNLKQKPTAFTNAYYRTREMFAASLFAGAAAGTTMTFRGKSFDTTSADGLQAFSTAHTPKITGATANQSNLYTNTFSEANLGLVETAMQNYKDDNGNILNVIPDTIVIPNVAALKKAVFAIVGADKDPTTAGMNGFNYQYGRWTIIVWPYWTPAQATNWVLLSSQYNEDNLGALWFDRMPLTIKSDEDPNTWNMRWAGMARFTGGFHDWRFAAMCGYTGGSTLS